MPPLGEEQQQPSPKPQYGSGADAGALLEDRAEHGEVQRDPADAQLRGHRAQLGDHELHDAVGGGAVTAHQVQGDAVLAPGHEGEQGEQFAVLTEGLHEETVAVGGVAEAVQGHGEAAFGLGVAPVVGLADHILHLGLGEGAVAADTAVGAGAADAVDGLPGHPHVAAVEVEVRHVEDGLVAELEGAEAGAGVGRGSLLGGAHRSGHPGVPAGGVQPDGDGVRPGLSVADRVAAGEAHACLDTVGDGGLAAGREDDGLVAAGGEVAEGVLAAVGLEEGADAGLLVVVQSGLHALRAEERRGGVEEGERAEEAEQEVQGAGRASVVGGTGDESAADPVGGPGQPLALRQGAGEQFDEPPADQDPDGEPDDQDAEGPAYGGAAGGGVELPAGGDEQGQGEGAHDQGRDGVRVVAEHRAEQVGQDQQPEVDDDQPPGDLLAGGRRRGEQEEEDGVGEVGADRDDDLVQGVHDGAERGAQRRDEGQQDAERSDGAEEGRETLRHPAQGAVPGRPYRALGALLPGGLHGGTHVPTLGRARPPRPSSVLAAGRTWGFR